MNIKALMKQAQKMQKDMTVAKEEIDKTEYEGKSSFVNVKINGKKEILNVKIDAEKIEADEIEMLEDMIMVAMNDAVNKADVDKEKRLGKYSQGLTGLM